MNSKSILIAIAAFAVTTTGTQVFADSTFLSRSGLDQEKVEAFVEARELRLKGKNDEARDVLLKAGINEETLKTLRLAAKATHEEIEVAILSRNFKVFKEAVIDTPLYDLITTEDDFSMFIEAYNLKLSGKEVDSCAILNELGVNQQILHRFPGYRQKFHIDKTNSNLSEAEQDALCVARQANDIQTVERILAEAGVIDNWSKESKSKKRNIFR